MATGNAEPTAAQIAELTDRLRAEYQHEADIRDSVERTVLLRVPLPPAATIRAAVRKQVEAEFSTRGRDAERVLSETVDRRFELVMLELQRRSPSAVAGFMSSMIESALEAARRLDARFVHPENYDDSSSSADTLDYVWHAVLYRWVRDAVGFAERDALNFVAKITNAKPPKDSHADRIDSAIRKRIRRGVAEIRALLLRVTDEPVTELTFSDCVRLAHFDGSMTAADRAEVARLRRIIAKLDNVFAELAQRRGD
jgi:hypothetical protein